ncbi:hypothetical protein RRG08_057557 [Elysia crispata]|uniref:Uncharacterized protein n=1 Tax=Elysia crispata TaxID=231223 RepID=A0AAE0XNA8_9GAST|nr:hypothetical protein RRG08_057557 [Elysia crispata]
MPGRARNTDNYFTSPPDFTEGHIDQDPPLNIKPTLNPAHDPPRHPEQSTDQTPIERQGHVSLQEIVGRLTPLRPRDCRDLRLISRDVAMVRYRPWPAGYGGLCPGGACCDVGGVEEETGGVRRGWRERGILVA